MAITNMLFLAAVVTVSSESPLPSDIPPDAVFYTQEDVKRSRYPEPYYPPEAMAAKVDAEVVVDCEVNTNGRLKRCAVVIENPPGMGFGKPTAILFLKHAKVKTETGSIPPGTWKKFRFLWRYQDYQQASHTR